MCLHAVGPFAPLFAKDNRHLKGDSYNLPTICVARMCIYCAINVKLSILEIVFRFFYRAQSEFQFLDYGRI
jgi:hypothetical protein